MEEVILDAALEEVAAPLETMGRRRSAMEIEAAVDLVEADQEVKTADTETTKVTQATRGQATADTEMEAMGEASAMVEATAVEAMEEAMEVEMGEPLLMTGE